MLPFGSQVLNIYRFSFDTNSTCLIGLNCSGLCMTGVMPHYLVRNNVNMRPLDSNRFSVRNSTRFQLHFAPFHVLKSLANHMKHGNNVQADSVKCAYNFLVH